MSGYHTENIRFRAQDFTLFNPPTASETIIADSDLVAYWRLGESSGNFLDSSGNGYTMTDSGGGGGAANDRDVTNANIIDDDGAITLHGVNVPPERTTGSVLFGEAQPFAPMRSGGDVSLTFSSDAPFTIMGWFKPNSFPAAINYFPLFVCNEDNGGTAGQILNDLWYCPYTGQIMVVDKSTTTGWIVHAVITAGEGGVGATPIYSTELVTTSVWTHVAWTYPSGGGTNKLYINGALDTSWSNTHSHVVSYSFSPRIGHSAWFDSFTAQFFGETLTRVAYASFDEWAVFSAEKSPSFIATCAAG